MILFFCDIFIIWLLFLLHDIIITNMFYDFMILFCQAETELAALQSEHERMLGEHEESISQLQGRVQKLEGERKDLALRLEEEKR